MTTDVYQIQGVFSGTGPIRSFETRSQSLRVVSSELETHSTEPVATFRAIAQAIEEFERIRFRYLADRWLGDTGHLSVFRDAMNHPAYLSILKEAGPWTIKFILQELSERNGPWFDALEKLTGHRIETSPGNLRGLRSAWLRWGKAQGRI